MLCFVFFYLFTHFFLNNVREDCYKEKIQKVRIVAYVSHKCWKISLLWFDKTIKIGYLKSLKKNLSEKYNFVMLIIWFHGSTVIWNFFSKMIISLTRDFFVKFFDRLIWKPALDPARNFQKRLRVWELITLSFLGQKTYLGYEKTSTGLQEFIYDIIVCFPHKLDPLWPF